MMLATNGASCALDGLVSGYAPHIRSGKILVMLQAFIDDSASEHGDRRLYLAGYVNTYEKWAQFSADWQQALAKEPAIDYLKMAEAQNRRDQFQGWGYLDIEIKLMNLARIIKDSEPWSIHFSVSRNEYRDIVAPVAAFPAKNPYFACYIGVLISVSRLQEHIGSSVPVDFVFDEQSSLQADAVAMYDYIKQTMPQPEWTSMLGSTPIFRDDKDVLPLQAADMLAWHVRRETIDGELRPKRKLSDWLIGDARHVFAHFDHDSLRDMAEKMKDFPGREYVDRKADWKNLRPIMPAALKKRRK